MNTTQQTKFIKNLIKRIEDIACRKEFVPLLKYFREKNYIRCWQTLLGNIDWLRNNNCMELTNAEIEQLANNIGIEHRNDGSIAAEKTIVNGKRVKVKLYKSHANLKSCLYNTYRFNDKDNIIGHDTYYKPNGDVDKICIKGDNGTSRHTIIIDEIMGTLDNLVAENERLNSIIKELEDSIIIHEKY